MSRPRIQKTGGARQKVWNALRRRKSPATIRELADVSGATAPQVRGFLAVLHDHGYLDWRADGPTSPAEVTLVKDTGPSCPSVSTERRTVHDWNVNPPMTGAELRRIWSESGLSMNQFGVALGLGQNNGTRLKQMMDGHRPVTPTVESAASEIHEGRR